MKTALEMMETARAAMMTDQPFYASLALHLELVEDTTCKTAWVDGKRLGFNPPYVLSLTPSEQRGLIAHEVAHCAKLHHVRRNGRELKKWNEACDYSINPELIEAGFNLPKGGLNNPAYAPLSEEEIYNLLLAKEEQEKKNQSKPGKDGKPSDGGAAGASKPGDKPGEQGGAAGDKQGDVMGEVRDAAPAHDAATATEIENEWRSNVRQALAVAKAHNAGTMPGHLQQIDKVSIAPRVDWKQELRAFIDQSNVKAPSWSRPNKRYLSQGLILPGLVSDSLSHLVIVADDSSSIDLDMFHASMAEAAAALDEGAADRITVVLCNVAVHAVYEFERGDVLNITTRGNGGTKFSPAFAWIEENAPDASAIVYLTDLDCKDFGPEPAAPVLWAAYGPVSAIAKRAAKVPFGEVLHLAA